LLPVATATVHDDRRKYGEANTSIHLEIKQIPKVFSDAIVLRSTEAQ
jgi:hypothetical protein